ncbi:MAG: hypothetical protein ACI8XQ_001301 [Bermanella sp.]|jgi:hypothetical protein
MVAGLMARVRANVTTRANISSSRALLSGNLGIR